MVRMRAALIGVLLAGALSLAACSGQSATPVEPVDTGAAPIEGEQLARNKCTMCHTYDRVEQASKSAAEWESTIERMVDHGLVVTPEERAAITDYLAGQGQ